MATVVASVPLNWTSEISRLIRVTFNCCLVPSIRKSRSSGWESVALKLLLNVGLKFANTFDVTCLLLLKVKAKSPPPHFSAWLMPAL